MAKVDNKPKSTKTINKNKPYNRVKYTTFNGHKLTPQEAQFIDLYIETGNQRQSVIEAGYHTKAPGQYAQTLLNKVYIAEEIQHRMDELHNKRVASANEIMEYFSAVMRGEIKDQFGLDAPLGERTKAAQELAKRQIDIANKVAGKNQAEVKIKLVRD
jgi:phage terminase small subunit